MPGESEVANAAPVDLADKRCADRAFDVERRMVRGDAQRRVEWRTAYGSSDSLPRPWLRAMGTK
jgi:hypothetical protein